MAIYKNPNYCIQFNKGFIVTDLGHIRKYHTLQIKGLFMLTVKLLSMEITFTNTKNNIL